MIFDKNKKRIKELEKALKAEINPIEKDKIQVRIEKVKQSGPEWWIRFKDLEGKFHDEKVPDNYRGNSGAEAYFYNKVKEVDGCEYIKADYLDVKLQAILEYFRETKNNSADTRTIHKRLNIRYGHLNFKRVITEPLLLKKITESMFSELSTQKYAWNHWIKLKAAFNNWIDLHNLKGKVSNPCIMIEKLLGLEPGTNVREVSPTREEFNRLVMICYQEGVPQVTIDLLEAVWETGLRIGEVLKWKCQDMHLNLVTDSDGKIIEIPYFDATISKQRRRTRIQIPMTPRLWEILKRVIRDRTDGYVFPMRNAPYDHLQVEKTNGTGKKYTISVYELAGLSHVEPFHDYRKSKKSDLKLQGYTSEYTKYFQGHATDSMDSYYTNFKRKDMQSVYLGSYQQVMGDQKGPTKDQTF